MFELFIALIGGSYISAKTQLEKSKHNCADKKWNKYKSICSKTTNREVERKVLHAIKTSKAYRIKMIKGLEDELTEVLGINYLSFFRYYITNYTKNHNIKAENEYSVLESDFRFGTSYGFKNVWYLAFSILMSKVGYIPCDVCEYGIDYIIVGMSKDASKIATHKALKIIEENIKRNNQDLDICLRRDEKKYVWSHWMDVYS